MVDYEIELDETLKAIERIEAVIAPYETQLDELHDKVHQLRESIALEKCGLRIGDKLAVTEELQSQLVAYAWRETWSLGAVITVDGVRFSDGDRAPKDYYEISVQLTSHERTFTPVKIAKKMRAAYLASKADE